MVDTELEEDLNSAAKGNLRLQTLCLKRKGSWDVFREINHNFLSAVGRKPEITNVDATEIRFFFLNSHRASGNSSHVHQSVPGSTFCNKIEATK